MTHHLSYLLLSPAAIHLAFWPPDCGRFHPLHPLFAPNRVAQADHGMPENTKQHFCVPEECVEGVGTSPSTSKISPAPPTTSPSETAYDTALRSCLRRAGVPSLYPHQLHLRPLLVPFLEHAKGSKQRTETHGMRGAQQQQQQTTQQQQLVTHHGTPSWASSSIE